MQTKFCANEQCDLHVNSPENVITFPTPVGSHIEFKEMKRVLVRSRKYSISVYICERCAGVLEVLKKLGKIP